MSYSVAQPIDLLSPGGNLEAYIQSVNSIPMLTPEKEKALAEALYFEGDLEAARHLVMAHLRFVVYVARSYNGYGLSEADLIQEGNVGLMKAVKRFDPGYNVRLVSFAVHWIKAEMHEFILRNWRIVKVATTKAQRKLFFNLRSSKKRLGWMNAAEVSHIASELGVDEAVVRQMEGRMSAQDDAFDGPFQEDDGPVAPAQYLHEEGHDPSQLVEAMATATDEMKQLTSAMSNLDDRARTIVERRWLQEKKSTLHELASEFDVSAERIRQLEQNALKKLRLSVLPEA